MKFRSSWVIALLCLAAPVTLAAQCSSAPQEEIRANPNRPTVADPAEITEYGVLEVEYGWNHTWLGGQARENDFGALLKFAALCNLEIRLITVYGLQRQQIKFLASKDFGGGRDAAGEIDLAFRMETAGVNRGNLWRYAPE